MPRFLRLLALLLLIVVYVVAGFSLADHIRQESFTPLFLYPVIAVFGSTVLVVKMFRK